MYQSDEDRWIDVRRTKEAVEAGLLKLTGVTGVDVGYKELAGRQTGVVAIRVFVEKKLDVPPEQATPQEMHGVPPDVIESRFVLRSSKAAASASNPGKSGNPEGAMNPSYPARSSGGRTVSSTRAL